ncbi:hypothetical protein A2Z23_00190 [Candidatus Curtissbacteria bacterium RBG_16_39_7]|uniref:HD domain-containing protein n=1 Tax=Candidatus Curtissbacteria bacterium RBG_16_39_7 TaxID=1797707 RepID=A0A1F5G370_9BACT|nr:MAG: hypothetical protein A2Z23_00190 [Candidatus Curtissbacteria bacterium RBG_16_39_7]
MVNPYLVNTNSTIYNTTKFNVVVMSKMEFEGSIFKDFTGRDEKLKQIVRFNMYPVMYYRTNLLTHSSRVCWLVEELTLLTSQTWIGFNQELTRTLALVHDDAEIITGDVQLGHKLEMSAEQLAVIDEQESAAIDTLSQTFPPSINGFPYRQLLTHALEKDCIEAQIVSFADKLDAYGESMHELFAGNTDFIPPCKNYTRILTNFAHQFPQLRDLFSHDHPLLLSPKDYDFGELAQNQQPHTPESIRINTGYPRYDFWKKLTIKKLGEGGVALLVTQREFRKERES